MVVPDLEVAKTPIAVSAIGEVVGSRRAVIGAESGSHPIATFQTGPFAIHEKSCRKDASISEAVLLVLVDRGFPNLKRFVSSEHNSLYLRSRGLAVCYPSTGLTSR